MYALHLRGGRRRPCRRGAQPRRPSGHPTKPSSSVMRRPRTKVQRAYLVRYESRAEGTGRVESGRGPRQSNVVGNEDGEAKSERSGVTGAATCVPGNLHPHEDNQEGEQALEANGTHEGAVVEDAVGTQLERLVLACSTRGPWLGEARVGKETLCLPS